MAADDTRNASQLAVLCTILETAGVLVGKMSRDATFARLLTVLASVPPEDRETILTVLEREVELRQVSRASEELTGWQMRPNANARLYVRTLGTHDPGRMSATDADGMTIVLQRLGRILPTVRGPALLDQFRESLRRAYGTLDVEERAAVVEHARDVLAIAAEVDQATPVGS